MFTEFKAQEIIVLGIDRRRVNRYVNKLFLSNLAYDAQMPLAYGGGIRSLDDAKIVFSSGFEKIVLNSTLFSNPGLVKNIVDVYGSQAVIASVDYRNKNGELLVYINHGLRSTGQSLQQALSNVVGLGVGELLISDISREGSWSGFDIDTVTTISKLCTIPLIANCGCGSIADIQQVQAINDTSAGIGSFVVFHDSNEAILINHPATKCAR